MRKNSRKSCPSISTSLAAASSVETGLYDRRGDEITLDEVALTPERP
jgi:hypothetical protein